MYLDALFDPEILTGLLIEGANTEGANKTLLSAHSPQPPGALCLVDVDEVGHHASLQQTALCLHSDLEQKHKHGQKRLLSSCKNKLKELLQHLHRYLKLHVLYE